MAGRAGQSNSQLSPAENVGLRSMISAIVLFKIG